MKIKKMLTLLITAVSILTLLAGCGSGTSAGKTSPSAAATASQSSAQPSGKPAASEVKTIKIGIGNAYNPMCYLDANGNLQGYEYETLKKINELLPQYKFEYEPTEFKNILVGLDTHTYDIGVHHYGWNADRDKKYLYANVADFYTSGKELVVAKGSKIVANSIDDLAGLTITAGTSSLDAYNLEQYNKQHPDKPVKIVYDDGTFAQTVTKINNGVYDGILGEAFIDAMNKKAVGDVFDVTGKQLFFDSSKKNGTYFIFNYGDEKLRDDIDGALQQLLDNGWEKALSEKLLGGDYTVDLSKK